MTQDALAAELRAMETLVEHLEPLDSDGRRRVIEGLAAQHNINLNG